MAKTVHNMLKVKRNAEASYVDVWANMFKTKTANPNDFAVAGELTF